MAGPKILADEEILAARENQADDRILAGIEIPAPGEKPAFVEKLAELEKQAGLESKRPAYYLGSVESPTADFFPVPLMSSCSPPRRCDESRM